MLESRLKDVVPIKRVKSTENILTVHTGWFIACRPGNFPR